MFLQNEIFLLPSGEVYHKEPLTMEHKHRKASYKTGQGEGYRNTLTKIPASPVVVGRSDPKIASCSVLTAEDN